MPHIIIEYSQNMGPELDMPELLASLHDTLAAQGVDKARIKTRAVPLPHSVVGLSQPNDGFMAHATLQLLEGRDAATKRGYGQALYDVLKSSVHAAYPDCAVTLEVRDMDKDTYFL